MPPDYAGTIFVKLCFSGPLLYAGLSMVIDPASFMASLHILAHMVARALRTFEQRLHGLQWQERWSEPDVLPASARVRNAVRLAGVALSACALLPWLAK